MDMNHGVGGSYVIDPKSGERKLIERTKETDGAPVPAPAPEPQQTPSKED